MENTEANLPEDGDGREGPKRENSNDNENGTVLLIYKILLMWEMSL